MSLVTQETRLSDTLGWSSDVNYDGHIPHNRTTHAVVSGNEIIELNTRAHMGIERLAALGTIVENNMVAILDATIAAGIDVGQ